MSTFPVNEDFSFSILSIKTEVLEQILSLNESAPVNYWVTPIQPHEGEIKKLVNQHVCPSGSEPCP